MIFADFVAFLEDFREQVKGAVASATSELRFKRSSMRMSRFSIWEKRAPDKIRERVLSYRQATMFMAWADEAMGEYDKLNDKKEFSSLRFANRYLFAAERSYADAAYSFFSAGDKAMRDKMNAKAAFVAKKRLSPDSWR